MIGQFTYTSFDPGGGQRGGWNVQASTGNLTPEIEQELRRRIATRLDLTRALPTFPTLAEIDDLPRRFVHCAVAGGQGLWHTVPAGADAAGRPGNVFVHVVYVSNDDEKAKNRFIDLWGSEDWLVPYGPLAVADAVTNRSLVADLPRCGKTVSRKSVAQFFEGSESWRRRILVGPLLDAVVRALESDNAPPVILGVDDSAEGAQWLGVLSHLIPVTHARKLNFSTWESAETSRRAIQDGCQIVCMPHGDTGLVNIDKELVVIDSGEVPQRRQVDSDEIYETQAGSVITTTPFSMIAREVVSHTDYVESLLAEADEQSTRVSASKSIGYSLASAVFDHPDLFVDVQREAASILGRPQVLGLSPAISYESEWSGDLRELADRVEIGPYEGLQDWLHRTGLPEALLRDYSYGEVIQSRKLPEKALDFLREAVSGLVKGRVALPPTTPQAAFLGAVVPPEVLDWLGVQRWPIEGVVPGFRSIESLNFLDRERLIQNLGVELSSGPQKLGSTWRLNLAAVLADARRHNYQTAISLEQYLDVHRLKARDILDFPRDLVMHLPDFAFIYPLFDERESNDDLNRLIAFAKGCKAPVRIVGVVPFPNLHTESYTGRMVTYATDS